MGKAAHLPVRILFLLALAAGWFFPAVCRATEIVIPFSQAGDVHEIKTFPGISATFSSDGRFFLVETVPSNSFRLYDAKNWSELRSFSGDSASFSPQSSIFILKTGRSQSTWDGTNYYYPTTLYDIASWQVIRSFPESTSVNENDTVAIMSDFHGRLITLYNVQTGKEIKTFSGRGGALFSPDKKLFAHVNATFDKTIIYDPETWKEIRFFPGHYPVFHPDGKELAIAANGKFNLYELSTGKIIWTITGMALEFSPDGKFAVVRDYQQKQAGAYEAGTGKLIRKIQNGIPFFSPDSRFAAMVASAAKMVYLYDTTYWKELKTFSGTAAAFSPDSRILAVGDRGKAKVILNDISSLQTAALTSDLEKGEFETTQEYEQRVGKWEHPYSSDLVPGKYDADKNGFTADLFGTKILISIPRERAREISIKKDSLRLEGKLKAHSPEHLALTDVFAIDKATNQKYAVEPLTATKTVTPYATPPAYSVQTAEDIRKIPNFHSPVRPNDLAIVIGIERYQSLPGSAYSQNDASLVKEYLKALGFPERNIELLINERATKSALEKTLEVWLPNRSKKGGRVFIYYSGHGAPDPAKGDAYIVPYDGDPNYLSVTGYPLKRLYKKMENLPAAEVVIVLDACFSGAGERSVLASGARPLVITTAETPRSSRMAVLTATQGAQISSSSPERAHGIFTYYFLRALQEGKSNVGEIYEYLKPLVEDEAKTINVQQSPGIYPSSEKLAGKFYLVNRHEK